MDSQPPSDGYLLEIVDKEWRLDELPYDVVTVPADKLPDPEADSGDSHLSLTEQEQKWNDLGLSTLAPETGINDPVNVNIHFV